MEQPIIINQSGLDQTLAFLNKDHRTVKQKEAAVEEEQVTRKIKI